MARRTSTPTNAGLKDTIAEALQDPETQQLAAAAMKETLREAVWTMQNGTRADKMQVMRTLLPLSTKLIERLAEGDTDTELRDEFEAMLAEMRA